MGDGSEYVGFKEISLSAEEAADLVQNTINDNKYECIRNEYLIINDLSGSAVGQYRWDGKEFHKVNYKAIYSKYCGKVKPRNVLQQVAIDMLYNDDITVKMISGKYGTGKDMLMCSVAVDMLEHNKIDKIVFVRNNIEVKNSKPIGFLPGTNDEKLMPYAMVLADKLGGIDSLEMMIAQDRIEIAHLGFIRGRDIRNSIVYCTEAENMTKEHVQLLLGRIGEGSSLWINGDCRQTDMEVFKENSGMKCLVDRLKGHPLFGYIQLMKTERSETAALADLLD